MTDQTTVYCKPLPAMEGLTKQFYDWCRKGTLHFQRCTACGTFRHVPRDICADCGSFDWEWAPSNGRGKVYTWTVVVRALHPAFVDATLLVPVVVEMEEPVRLLSRLIDCAPDRLVIGLPVQVIFQAVTDDVTLPFFRPA